MHTPACSLVQQHSLRTLLLSLKNYFPLADAMHQKWFGSPSKGRSFGVDGVPQSDVVKGPWEAEFI
jgi:hypothetical protein